MVEQGIFFCAHGQDRSKKAARDHGGDFFPGGLWRIEQAIVNFGDLTSIRNELLGYAYALLLIDDAERETFPNALKFLRDLSLIPAYDDDSTMAITKPYYEEISRRRNGKRGISRLEALMQRWTD